MSDVLAGIGVAILAVIVIAVAVAGAAIALAIVVAITLSTAVLTIAILLILLPANYAVVMFTAFDNELRIKRANDRSRAEGFFRLGLHEDQSVTLPSYFFGPAETDFERIFSVARNKTYELIGGGFGLAKDTFKSEPPFLNIPLAIGIAIGTFLGALAGSIAAAMMLFVHLIIIVISVLSALCTCGVLKVVDLLIRSFRNIRMTCPICASNVRPYPVYKCRRCGALHREIRPGSRGVAVRTCTCGARLPTLILTGTTRLTALCPRCNSELPPRFGKVPEIVIPFFGCIKAGKTQLIYVLVKTLEALVADSDGEIELLGDTRDRMERIGRQIGTTGEPGKTVAHAPQAHILRLKLGSGERLVYLFDAAGELHYRFAGLEQMAYLDKARTMVFVADPLASDSIWDDLTEDQRVELANVRSSSAETEVSYQMTREQMRRSKHSDYAERLGFVVSKADLLSDRWTQFEQSGRGVRDFVGQVDGMNMGNLVREATQNFSDVHFFKTTAMIDELGSPDESIKSLALWLMSVEGINLGRSRK